MVYQLFAGVGPGAVRACPVQTWGCSDECVSCVSGPFSSEAAFGPQGCLSFGSTLSFRCKSKSKASRVINQLLLSIAGTTRESHLAKVNEGKSGSSLLQTASLPSPQSKQQGINVQCLI